MSNRAGITMLELVVVLAIMGVMAGVVGFAVVGVASPPPPNSAAAARAAIAAARRQAVTQGASVTIAILVETSDGTAATAGRSVLLRATALPDGSVIADSALGVDRLSGRPAPSRSEQP